MNMVSDHEDVATTVPGKRKRGPGRKPRACVECKRQKMKCEVPIGGRTCVHCQRRNLNCIIRSNTTATTADPSPATEVESLSPELQIKALKNELSEMRRSLETLVQRGAAIVDSSTIKERSGKTRNNNSFTPHSLGAQTFPSETSLRDGNMQMAMTRENSIETDLIQHADRLQQEPVTVDEPMSSLYEVTRLRNIRSNKASTVRPHAGYETHANDFIARGVVSEAEARELYATFHTSLNHYLWVGLEQLHDSLTSVRRSSELLTATILTVTALHIPMSAETFDNCYKEFLSLISSSMFSRYHSVDDVRALCIAAFWLSDVSWKLSGHAIRIATELGIHQSFHKALSGDREHFLRARLWYMLYVCDHHFSIAYGRPPMISESLQIREHEMFLQNPLADELDQRILSQVSLMQILTKIHDRFVEQRLPRSLVSSIALTEDDLTDMRNFNLEIDQWRMRWQVRQKHNKFIGTFPPKGIVLYSYFAKLQLNSLAVRGVSASYGSLSTERKEFANTAISAAVSILTFVLEEEDMRRALVGTPLYVHTMLAFASVFLMKVATKWNRVVGLNVEREYVLELLKRMITLLKVTTTSDRHVLPHLAAGLEKMLVRSQSQTQPPHLLNPLDARNDNSTINIEERIDDAGQQLMQHSSFDNINHDYGTWVDEHSSLENGAFTDMTIMNDGWIYEAFGSDSANDVYNLLTSQFSY